jgi:uncharacterized membrane protein YidH (DUF202 family)
VSAAERPGPRDLPGLQAERTELAWERTALGILASGVFLLLRQQGSLDLGRVLLAVAALSISVLAAVTGWLRGRRIQAMRAGGRGPGVPEARVEVVITGWTVAAFAVGTIVALFRS